VQKEAQSKYARTHFSNIWLYVTIILHTTLFCALLSFGHSALTTPSLAAMCILIVLVPVLLIMARTSIPNKSYALFSTNTSPKGETDLLSDHTIKIMCAAILTESFAFALYPAISSGAMEAPGSTLSKSGAYSYSTISQLLSFTALVLGGFYRTIRPANRLDPLRTIMEVMSTYLHTLHVFCSIYKIIYLTLCVLLLMCVLYTCVIYI
jgi:hypothetical protein